MFSSAFLLSAKPRTASFFPRPGHSTRPEEITTTFLMGFSVKNESGARRLEWAVQPKTRIANEITGAISGLLFISGFPFAESELSQYSSFAHVFQHARMDQVPLRRGGERVGERGFLRLLELRAQRGFALVDCARELVRRLVGQPGPREHQR